MNFRDVPIGSAFDVQNGATPASGEPSYWDGDTPWVSPADLGKLNTRFIENGERSITQDGYASCGTQMVPAGSIILSIRAPIGHIAIASNSMCFNQGCRGLVPRSMIRSDFSYWALVACRPKLEAAGQGTTFIELSRDKLRSERIPIPVHETQKAIADFLDRETARIDQLIEKKQRMVEVLGEKRQAVISRAVTKGLDADVPMKDSGVVWLGDIPVHWDVKQLRRAIMFRRGHDLPTDEREEGEVVIVSSSGVSSTHSRAIAKAPGIVTGRYGTIGQFHLINQDYWPLNTTLYSINLYGNEPRFLLYMLAHMSPQFLAHAVKSAVPGVDRKDVHADHVAVPPISEQRAIAAFLDRETVRIDTLVTKIRETIDRLREFRSALITAAVTGQIDVSTWSNQGTSDRRLDQIEEATSA